jgi:hypothetical protein
VRKFIWVLWAAFVVGAFVFYPEPSHASEQGVDVSQASSQSETVSATENESVDTASSEGASEASSTNEEATPSKFRAFAARRAAALADRVMIPIPLGTKGFGGEVSAELAKRNKAAEDTAKRLSTSMAASRSGGGLYSYISEAAAARGAGTAFSQENVRVRLEVSSSRELSPEKAEFIEKEVSRLLREISEEEETRSEE